MRPANGAIIATTTDQGVIRKPVCTGSRPSEVAKKNGSDTNARHWVANEQNAVNADRANIGRLSRSSGNIGAGCPTSRLSIAAPPTRKIARAINTLLIEPSCAAWLRAKISAPKVMTLRMAVMRSNVRLPGLTDGSEFQANTSANTPMGRLIANNQGQLATDSTSEAMVGPMENDTPTTRAFMPRPRPRRSWGKIELISPALTLMIALAPRPCSTRATVRVGNDQEKVHSAEDSTNRINPPR